MCGMVVVEIGGKGLIINCGVAGTGREVALENEAASGLRRCSTPGKRSKG